MGHGCKQLCHVPTLIAAGGFVGVIRDKVLADRAGHPALPREPVALPRGWHCPVAGITLLPFQGRQLCLHPVHGVGVLGLVGKWDDDPKPAPNPRQSLPIPHAWPGRECAEAAPGGDRLCL